MNSFDRGILLFLNSYAGRWPWLDSAVVSYQGNNLLCNAIFMAVICGFWFKASTSKRSQLANRQVLFATCCATLTGIVVARLLAHLLPFRLRPIAVPELEFSVPAHADANSLISWSAFPSDHAVVWFALATGILFSNTSLGVLAILYAGLLSLIRVYMGYHSPTDVMGGAVIGCVLSWILVRPSVRSVLYAPFERLEARYSGLFYGTAFLALYEMSDMFDDVRQAAVWVTGQFHLL